MPRMPIAYIEWDTANEGSNPLHAGRNILSPARVCRSVICDGAQRACERKSDGDFATVRP